MPGLVALIIAACLLRGVAFARMQAISTEELMLELRSSADVWPPMELQRPVLPLIFDSPNFRIHYDVVGENAVYHPDEDIDPQDGVPDYVNRMSEYLEAARYTYLVVYRFDSPPPDYGLGGDERYDIYVTTIPGLTVPEFPSSHYPGRLAYVSYAYIGCDLRTQQHPDDPLPFLKATCAHEYFHAVQMAYRAYTSDETMWWYELTANWAEELVFDELNEIYFYLPDFYNDIHKSIYLSGGRHMYGAWTLAEYLARNLGVGAIRRVFEKLISFDRSLLALTAAMQSIPIDINTVFAAHAGWNYFTGPRWVSGFFDEGENFPATVPIAASHHFFPTGLMITPRPLENLGTAYVEFVPSDHAKGELVITFEGYNEREFDLALASIYDNGSVLFQIETLEPGQLVSLRVSDVAHLALTVLAITWGYEGRTIYGTTGYCYEAYLDTTVGVTAEETTLPEDFHIRAVYPNPFNMVSRAVFYWPGSPTEYWFYVFDVNGRQLQSINGQALKGLNVVEWFLDSNRGSGVYFYQLLVGGRRALGKAVFLK